MPFVVDTSVSLPATLSPGGLMRRFWVVLALGARSSIPPCATRTSLSFAASSRWSAQSAFRPSTKTQCRPSPGTERTTVFSTPHSSQTRICWSPATSTWFPIVTSTTGSTLATPSSPSPSTRSSASGSMPRARVRSTAHGWPSRMANQATLEPAAAPSPPKRPRRFAAGVPARAARLAWRRRSAGTYAARPAPGRGPRESAGA